MFEFFGGASYKEEARAKKAVDEKNLKRFFDSWSKEIEEKNADCRARVDEEYRLVMEKYNSDLELFNSGDPVTEVISVAGIDARYVRIGDTHIPSEMIVLVDICRHGSLPKIMVEEDVRYNMYDYELFFEKTINRTVSWSSTYLPAIKEYHKILISSQVITISCWDFEVEDLRKRIISAWIDGVSTVKETENV